MNAWVAQQMTDQHRRELSALAQRSRPRVRPTLLENPAAPMRLVASTEAAPNRRPVVPLVGNWLIKAGTRLGGATIRTS